MFLCELFMAAKFRLKYRIKHSFFEVHTPEQNGVNGIQQRLCCLPASDCDQPRQGTVLGLAQVIFKRRACSFHVHGTTARSFFYLSSFQTPIFFPLLGIVLRRASSLPTSQSLQLLDLSWGMSPQTPFLERPHPPPPPAPRDYPSTSHWFLPHPPGQMQVSHLGTRSKLDIDVLGVPAL